MFNFLNSRFCTTINYKWPHGVRSVQSSADEWWTIGGIEIWDFQQSEKSPLLVSWIARAIVKASTWLSKSRINLKKNLFINALTLIQSLAFRQIFNLIYGVCQKKLMRTGQRRILHFAHETITNENQLITQPFSRLGRAVGRKSDCWASNKWT